ncbi:unnamed protein product [Auanema sp. JU1783]|nr:unnamed protein product [Auanema sp. JU1783]
MLSRKYLVLIAVCPLLFTCWLSHPVKLEPKKEIEVLHNEEVITKPYRIEVSDDSIESVKSFVKEWKTENSDNQFFENLTQVIIDYDWKSHQNYLNTFKHYNMKIDGINVHFLRANVPPNKNMRVVPLVLLHGFPGSFYDYYKMIPLLSNPTRHGFDFGISKPIIFDVIVPSIPGFTFSELNEEQAADMDIHKIAGIIVRLLEELDVNDYIIHGSNKFGGDLAGLITSVSPQAKAVHISNPYIDVNYNTKVWIYSVIDCYLNRNRCDKIWDETKPYVEVTDDLVEKLRESPIEEAKLLMRIWKNSLSGEIVKTEDGLVLSRKKELNELFTYDELATTIYLHSITNSLPSALKIMQNSYMDSHPRSQIVDKPVGISFSTECPWIFNSELLTHKFLNHTILRDNEDRPIKGGLFHYIQDPQNSAAHIFSFAEYILQ